DRDRARALVAEGDFIEIYCAAELEVCEGRDPKGLYAKARAGVIKDFTGISSPYEQPEAPELTIDTGRQSLQESVSQVIEYLVDKGVLKVLRDYQS
ncbi:adenylyl-sulfate kinase, partial [Synechococcus lacustris]